MNNTIKIFVDEGNSGKRIDVFLKESVKNIHGHFLKNY